MVLHIDAVGSFRSSKRDFDSVEVILEYSRVGNERTKSISCHPKNVTGFVKALQERCPNLVTDME